MTDHSDHESGARQGVRHGGPAAPDGRQNRGPPALLDWFVPSSCPDPPSGVKRLLLFACTWLLLLVIPGCPGRTQSTDGAGPVGSSSEQTKNRTELFSKGEDAPQPLVITPLVFAIWEDRAQVLLKAS